MPRLLPAALALSALMALGLGPSQDQEPAYRSSAQTVAVYATVVDAQGRLVPDLQERHFEIFDNTRPRPISLFKSDIQPITVVVMLDTSGSMTLTLDLLKVAAERFVLRLLPTDRARIGTFSEKIRISDRFTSNRDDLIRILHTDFEWGNATFLWDALDRSMTALSRESGRRVVLVFTDGADQKSQVSNFERVITRAQNEDFMIYAIGLASPVLGTKPDGNLRKLAEATGGGYFELKRTADLDTTFTRVADELHRQYILGFSAEPLDGLVHKLDIRVKLPGMAVRARKSYLASANAGPR